MGSSGSGKLPRCPGDGVVPGTWAAGTRRVEITEFGASSSTPGQLFGLVFALVPTPPPILHLQKNNHLV